MSLTRRSFFAAVFALPFVRLFRRNSLIDKQWVLREVTRTFSVEEARSRFSRPSPVPAEWTVADVVTSDPHPTGWNGGWVSHPSGRDILHVGDKFTISGHYVVNPDV